MAKRTKKMPSAATVSPGKVLVLRTCRPNMSGIHDHAKALAFRWPKAGPVECDDWNPEAVCGGGLHGLLWGEGDDSTLRWEADSAWLVVEVAAASVVDLGGKVKFQRGEVVYCGDRIGATTYVKDRAPGRAIVGCTATAGDAGTATAGARGTATAGYAGTATAGDAGTATAGYAGTATAGARGIILLPWWDGARRRIATLYVGENGIEAGQPYRLDDKGRPVKAAKRGER